LYEQDSAFSEEGESGHIPARVLVVVALCSPFFLMMNTHEDAATAGTFS